MSCFVKAKTFRTMQLLPKIVTSKNFSACEVMLSQFPTLATRNANRKNRLLNKFLNGSQKKKWYPNVLSVVKPSKSVPSTSVIKMITPRRIYVLNTLFMEHITEVMSTGEIGSQLQGYGIEISKVQVTRDYKLLNVFWMIPNCDSDRLEAAEKILNSLSGEIRNLLSSLRLMGHIPKITFVKDPTELYMRELEHRFAAADYGLPQELQEPDNDVNLSSDEECLSDKDIAPQDQKHADLLVEPSDMRQDLYGLDHRRLMNEVLQFRKKAEAAHKDPDCPYVFHEVPKSNIALATFSTVAPDESGTAKVRAFLRARMQEMSRSQKKHAAEREAYREEAERTREVVNSTFEEYEDEPDYFEESQDFYKRDA